MANTLSTNLSLQTPIIESVTPADRINIGSAQSANNTILEAAISGVQTAATTGVNATVINTNGARNVLIQQLSAGSISSITGMYTGVPFTLIFQSVGSQSILIDVSPFNIAGNFVATPLDTITLVWDGTSFYELGRSAN